MADEPLFDAVTQRISDEPGFFRDILTMLWRLAPERFEGLIEDLEVCKLVVAESKWKKDDALLAAVLQRVREGELRRDTSGAPLRERPTFLDWLFMDLDKGSALLEAVIHRARESREFLDNLLVELILAAGRKDQ